MAKGVMLIVRRACPHCEKAIEDMRELEKANPEFKDVDIDVVDDRETPEAVAGLDYYYLPTFFVGGEKVHEGKATDEDLTKVYRAALR